MTFTIDDLVHSFDLPIKPPVLSRSLVQEPRPSAGRKAVDGIVGAAVGAAEQTATAGKDEMSERAAAGKGAVTAQRTT